jgi:hypothetical protein
MTASAGVAQLVRAPPCHGGGRGFESRLSRQFFQWLSARSGPTFRLSPKTTFRRLSRRCVRGGGSHDRAVALARFVGYAGSEMTLLPLKQRNIRAAGCRPTVRRSAKCFIGWPHCPQAGDRGSSAEVRASVTETVSIQRSSRSREVAGQDRRASCIAAAFLHPLELCESDRPGVLQMSRCYWTDGAA